MENIRNHSNYEFDAEKLLKMSKKEAISILGPENAAKVTEGLKNGTLTYDNFQHICQESFPVPQQAKLVRNVIFNQLSKSEGFNMFESNKEKQQIYARMVELQDREQKGEFTQNDLREVCNSVFGKESDLSKAVQEEFIRSGKVKPYIPEQVASGPEATTEGKKTWELESKEKVRIQEQTAEIGHKYSEQSVQQSEIQQPVQQPPIQDFGGIEL